MNLPFFSLTDSNYNPNIKKEIDHNNFIQKEFSIKNKSDQYLEYNVIFLKSNDLVFGDGYWIFAKNISELKGFNEKIKYLEENLTTHQLITQKDKIESIFKKLKKFSEMKLKCAAEAKKTQSRLKKKQNAQL